jgi:hypothetical protein
MWQNFNTKQGTQQQKTIGMETLNTHFLLTVYILYKRTKFDNIDDRIDLSDLVLNFVILNNLNNNRLGSIQ